MTWWEDAACRGRSDVMHDRARAAEAVEVCLGCPVLDDCRADVVASAWAPVSCTQAATTWWPQAPPRVCTECGVEFWRRGRGSRCTDCITALTAQRDRPCACCGRLFGGRSKRYCSPRCQGRAAYRRRAGRPEADRDQEVTR